jgi:hypothetical protein
LRGLTDKYIEQNHLDLRVGEVSSIRFSEAGMTVSTSCRPGNANTLPNVVPWLLVRLPQNARFVAHSQRRTNTTQIFFFQGFTYHSRSDSLIAPGKIMRLYRGDCVASSQETFKCQSYCYMSSQQLSCLRLHLPEPMS